MDKKNSESISTNLIYPNPATNKLYIKSIKDIESIEIKDILGRNIIINPSGKEYFDISEVAAGIYYINFKNKMGNICETKKLTITHD